MTMFWLRKFPLENILVDISLLAAIFYFLPNLDVLMENNLSLMYWFAAPLQCLALACASFGSRVENLPELPFKFLDGLFGSIYALSLILAFGGFMWLFFPAFAIAEQSGVFPPGAFLFNFFFSIFGSLAAYFLAQDFARKREFDKFTVRLWTATGVFLYLIFTETLIEASARIAQMPVLVVVFVTAVSYLPVRLIISFREPFSFFDIFSALFFYGLFLYFFF